MVHHIPLPVTMDDDGSAAGLSLKYVLLTCLPTVAGTGAIPVTAPEVSEKNLSLLAFQELTSVMNKEGSILHPGRRFSTKR